MLVVGEKEMNENKVSVRRQGKGDAGMEDLQEFINMIAEEIKERKG
jgi:threonyl-tRNA synthetase